MASVYLSEPSSGRTQVISMGTGSKCLPTNRFSTNGDTVHDFHAEIVARRGAVRWLLLEMTKGHNSEWLEQEGEAWILRNGFSMGMFVSELPCGDASTRALASLQDSEMAELKSRSLTVTPSPGTPARGREGYDLLGTIRTKPGRADSPATTCQSCSDKIAMWSVVGMQGSLLFSLGLRPVKFNQVIVGNVMGTYGDISMIKEDCIRAFGGRLQNAGLKEEFQPTIPEISFTNYQFPHRRITGTSSSNEAMCWVEGDGKPEILVNGIRRGTNPKTCSIPHLRARIAKASLLECLYHATDTERRAMIATASYYQMKHDERAKSYHEAKAVLKSEGYPFYGWAVTDPLFEMFLYSPASRKVQVKKNNRVDNIQND